MSTETLDAAYIVQDNGGAHRAKQQRFDSLAMLRLAFFQGRIRRQALTCHSLFLAFPVMHSGSVSWTQILVARDGEIEDYAQGGRLR
jgi:hypothetical protein